MAFGIRASARTPRTTRPNSPGAGSTGGGGGGVGTPTAPSDVTTATPAPQMISWGSYYHAISSPGTYQTWKTWGFAGHAGSLSGTANLLGYGGTQTMIGSTAAALGSSYDWQKAYEGLGVAAINGGATGFGLFKAKQADPTIKAYLALHMNASGSPAAGPFGDTFDTALRADVASKIGLYAAGVKFLGGDGLGWDMEVGSWGTPTGHTTAATMIELEKFGYEVGTAMYTAFPAMELLVYSLSPQNSLHAHANGDTILAATDGRTQFLYGVMRAHTTLNATGRFRWLDHWWYRGGGDTLGLKYNTQATLAAMSRTMPAASWTHMAQLVDVTTFTWAGTDVTGFYTNTQEAQPAYTNNLETYRRYSMGGFRAEFTLEGSPGQNATHGFYTGQNNYSFPTGRLAGMAAAASTSGSYSTTAPTLSASMSGSGTTRTLTGTAAHAFGIRCIKAYIYPSGTPVMAQMTWNMGGGSLTTTLANAFMDYTIALTGVTAGDYAIVTAYSTQSQEHSVVVAL